MNKTTIELNRLKGHWSNWGRLFEKWDGPDNPLFFDAMVEWSKSNPSAKIYRHHHWRVEENKATEPITVVTSYDPERKVYPCDLVDYLDIYWQ